jgi:hypothetical protein
MLLGIGAGLEDFQLRIFILKYHKNVYIAKRSTITACLPPEKDPLKEGFVFYGPADGIVPPPPPPPPPPVN